MPSGGNCSSCMPPLYPENEDAVKIYFKACNQVILASTMERIVVVDIDVRAVKTLMDLYCIQNQRRCFEKVQWLFHEMRKHEREKD